MSIADEGLGTIIAGLESGGGGGGGTGTFWLGAASGWSSFTAGASAIQQVETPDFQQNDFVVNFESGSQTYFEWDTALPADYKPASTITAAPMWVADDPDLDPVVWGVQAVSFPVGVGQDRTWGIAVEVLSTNQGTLVINQDVTAAITIDGVPAASRRTKFRIYRLGVDPDILEDTALLLGVLITYQKA